MANERIYVPTRKPSIETPLAENPTIFANSGPRIMLGDRAIATAVSSTMARRIKNALNAYKPDRRGI